MTEIVIGTTTDGAPVTATFAPPLRPIRTQDAPDDPPRRRVGHGKAIGEMPLLAVFDRVEPSDLR